MNHNAYTGPQGCRFCGEKNGHNVDCPLVLEQTPMTDFDEHELLEAHKIKAEDTPS